MIIGTCSLGTFRTSHIHFRNNSTNIESSAQRRKTTQSLQQPNRSTSPKSSIMENERGDLVDLYVSLIPSTSPSLPSNPHTNAPSSPTPIQLTSKKLRPPQMLSNKPDNPRKRPRLRADFGRKSRRERPLHGREPDVCYVWICEGDGRGR